MKLPNFLKKVKPAEVFVFVVFVLYLIFPVTTPSMMSPYIESPLGMLLLFCLIVAMFLYCNPVLGVLFIFVAYTLLRRSASVRNKAHYVQHTKDTDEKKVEVQKQVNDATPPTEEPRNVGVTIDETVTLEEEVVQERAPIGRSEPVNFLHSSYKPVSTNLDGASSF